MNSQQTRRFAAALGLGVSLTLAGAVAFAADTAPRGPAAAEGSQPETQTQDQNLRPYVQRDRDANDREQVQRPGARVERRLALLHQRLNIRANQERAWNAFAEQVRDEARDAREQFQDRREPLRDRRDGRRGDRRAPPSVVDRLERRQEMLAAQSERAERMLQAVRPLYAALDANQKRTADRLLLRAGERFRERMQFFARRMPGRDFGGPGGRPRLERRQAPDNGRNQPGDTDDQDNL